MLDIHINDEEAAALEAYFKDDIGINYLKFLQILQPCEPEDYKYIKRLEELQETQARGSLPEKNAVGDLEKVLFKIKIKVSL